MTDRVPGAVATTRFTLAQALIGSELIARLLDYSKTNDDPRQLAQSWAHRIADWLDKNDGWSGGAVGEREEPDYDGEGLSQRYNLHGPVGEREEPPLNVERLARAYMRVRNAHNGDDAGMGPEPCDWCRMAAEQHVEAMSVYDRLSVNEGGLAPVARTEAEDPR